MENTQVYYDILGISRNAKADEIKRAYVRKGREYANDTEKMILLHQAYAYFREQGNSEQQEEVVEEVSISSYQDLAEQYIKQGKIDEAIECLLNIYKADVSYADDIKKLVRLYYEDKKNLKSVIPILNDCVDRCLEVKLKNIYLCETLRAVRILKSSSYQKLEETLCQKMESFSAEAKRNPENAEVLVTYMQDAVERKDFEGFHKLEKVYRLYDTKDVKLHQKFRETRQIVLDLEKESNSLQNNTLESGTVTNTESMNVQEDIVTEKKKEIEVENSYEVNVPEKNIENNIKNDAEKKSTVNKRVLGVVIAAVLIVILIVMKAITNSNDADVVSDNNVEDVNSYVNNQEDAVDKEETTVIVPNLLGMSEVEAREILEKYDLYLSINEYVYSSDYEKDCVMYQSVSGGTEIDRETTITVDISNGEEYALSHDGLLNQNELKKRDQLNEVYDEKTLANIRYIQLMEGEELVYPEDSQELLVWFVIEENKESFQLALAGFTEDEWEELYQKVNEIYISESTDYEKCEQFYEVTYDFIENK